MSVGDILHRSDRLTQKRSTPARRLPIAPSRKQSAATRMLRSGGCRGDSTLRERPVKWPHAWIGGRVRLEHGSDVFRFCWIEHRASRWIWRLRDARRRQRKVPLRVFAATLVEPLDVLQSSGRGLSHRHKVRPQSHVRFADQTSGGHRGGNAVPPPGLRRTLTHPNLGIERLDQIGDPSARVASARRAMRDRLLLCHRC